MSLTETQQETVNTAFLISWNMVPGGFSDFLELPDMAFLADRGPLLTQVLMLMNPLYIEEEGEEFVASLLNGLAGAQLPEEDIQVLSPVLAEILLDSGWSKGEFAWHLTQALLQADFSGTGLEAYASAQNTLLNKLEVAAYAQGQGLRTFDSAVLEELLVPITGDAESVDTARLIIDDLVAQIPGDTFRLTIDVDDFTGTPLDDLFIAPLADGEMTLQDNDRLDGGEGRDTLDAFIIGDFALGGILENIEVLNIQSPSSASLDLNAVTGVQEIRMDRMSEDLHVFNVASPVTLGIIRGDQNVFHLTYAENALGDEPFTQSITLNRSNATLDVSVDGDDTMSGLQFDVNGISRVALASDSFSGVAAITNTGTGAFDLDLGNLGGDLTISLGESDNILRLDGTDIDENDEIDLGGGFNSLFVRGITTAQAFSTLDVSRVEGLSQLGFLDDLSLTGDAAFDLGDLGDVVFGGRLQGSGGDVLSMETAAPTLSLEFENDPEASGLVMEVGGAFTELVLRTASEVTIANLRPIADLNAINSVVFDDLEMNGNARFDIQMANFQNADMIDLSGIGENGSVTINAAEANYGGRTDLLIGDSVFNYTTDSMGIYREVFQFVGEMINTVTIDGFVLGAHGGADRIDFSQFGSVSGIEDLSIVATSGNTEIFASDGQFDGMIRLIGVDNVSGLEMNGFIFQ